jgi:hypothetical protein
MNFRGVTHIIRNPAGSLSLVGAVPAIMERKTFETWEGAARAVTQAGGTICSLPTCACRRLESTTLPTLQRSTP